MSDRFEKYKEYQHELTEKENIFFQSEIDDFYLPEPLFLDEEIELDNSIRQGPLFENRHFNGQI